MNDQWVRWKPLANLTNNYYLEFAHNSARGLEILLFDANDRDKKVRIFSTHVILFYAVCHLRDIGTIPANWPFFEIENSRLIEHLREESGNLINAYYARHFAIVTANAIIDIVDSREPEMSYIIMDLKAKTLLYKEMALPYILSTLPTARIILHEPAIKKHTEQLHIVVDCGSTLNKELISKIEEDLQNSDVPLECLLTDMQTLSNAERNALVKNGIVWRD